MTTTIRTASREDALGIAKVHVASWQRAYSGLVPDRMLDELDAAERARKWEQVFQTREGEGIVALRDSEIAGFAYFSRSRDDGTAPTVGEVQAIYVHPFHWRSGCGRALLMESLSRLRRQGFEQVTLWVLAGNTAARKFYASFGFREDGGQMEHTSTGLLEVRYAKHLAEAP